jgi:hypothetical protein
MQLDKLDLFKSKNISQPQQQLIIKRLEEFCNSFITKLQKYYKIIDNFP